MSDSADRRSASRALVLSPQEALVAGGPAEELEQRIQTSLRQGYTRVVVDLRGVPEIDSAGIRGLVRGHTTAQRLQRQFSLVAPTARVRETILLSRLDRVFRIDDTLDTARSRQVRWDRWLTAGAVLLACAGLVLAGLVWPSPELTSASGAARLPGASGGDDSLGAAQPLFALAKLVVAAIVGMLVTAVHRQYRADRSPNPTMDQAQVLLCVAGALMMIIIGNSLARAFGIAGAASIVRFRTPVEDARDITVLFILMALGMAAGLGGFAVAGLGTLFLCVMFPLLNLFSAARPRLMQVEIEAEGRDFPMAHVERVFARNGIVFEPREVAQGEEATVRYLATLGPGDSLEDLGRELVADGKAGVKNVTWSPPKRV